MRKKRIVALLAILIAAVLFLDGCGALTFNSAENLVRPPKLSGDDGALQAAFEKSMSGKGEYVLKYPSAGEYRSAFVRYDCDGDGSDEAFVFYSLKAEEMSVYMYMLDYTGDEWIAVGEIPGEGNDIYSIEFCDLNRDGIAEVLVGWSSMDAKSNKKLSVYCSYKNSQNLNYRMLAIETYTEMYTADLDAHGEKEILLALINSTSDTYMTEARLLKMASGSGMDFQIKAVGQVSLYSEITAITNISFGKSGEKRYIYIDEAAGDTYLTELLYWDHAKNALVAPINVGVLTLTECPTGRSVSLNCADVDGDGEIEIPSTSLLQNSSTIRKAPVVADNAPAIENIPAENVYIINWMKYDGGKFTAIDSYIENRYDRFRIKYNQKDMYDMCVSFYPDEHLSQFFMIQNLEDPERENRTVLLFSLKAVEPEESVSFSTYLLTGEHYKYTYEITDEGNAAGITKSYILSIFAVTSGEGEL